MSGRGRLIALEGVDGCGKSTQAARLAGALGALSTAEPGSTALGKGLRYLFLDAELPPVSPRAEALLVAADRAQHVDEVVAPALEGGRWVVTERFSGSTLAYQGYGRGLDLDELRRLVAWAARGIAPDLTVLLDVPVAQARHRRQAAAADRLERLDDGFHERVHAGYLALAAADPEGWVVVDGTGDVDTVARHLLAVVVERLGPTPEPASAPWSPPPPSSS
ncbi:MAG TPA: dTMP kinase [Acidimicrobiales bacterium]|nr:dTMP kinase [Acidimicrobiales bacterium]